MRTGAMANKWSRRVISEQRETSRVFALPCRFSPQLDFCKSGCRLANSGIPGSSAKERFNLRGEIV